VAVGEDAVAGDGCEAVEAQAVQVVGVCVPVDGDAAVRVTFSQEGTNDEFLCRTDGPGRDYVAAGDELGGRVVQCGPFHGRERILY